MTINRTTYLLRVPMALGVIASAVLTISGRSDAQSSDDFCPLYQQASNTQQLRRLSLDLRRRLPTFEEYDALGDKPVPDALIDEYIASPDFAKAARRYHADLLWAHIDNTTLSSGQARLTTVKLGGVPTLVSAAAGRRKTHRGSADLICADYQQTQWCTLNDIQNNTPGCDAVGLPRKDENGQDGWVLVSPYWDPNECGNDNQCQSGTCTNGNCAPARVCAFDAQEAAYWTSDGSPASDSDNCNFVTGPNHQGCGCGPELRYCWGPGVETKIRRSVAEQLYQLVEAVTVGELPYSQLLTSQRTYYDGRLLFWKRYLAQMTTLNDTFNFYFEGDVKPPDDIDFNDTNWAPFQRSGVHSGIMTLPAFSLRFQTNRGRANRFRTAFTGQYFEPPAGTDSDCDPTTNDLTQQCGCRHCHATLEPLAAHFGNIAQAGSALLSDRNFFPTQLPCNKPGLLTGLEKTLCERFYVTDPNQANVGTLLPLQYAGDDTDVHKQIAASFEAGPIGWAESIIADGTFARTTVLNLWRHFMQREMNLDPLNPNNELAWLDTLTEELREHDSFKQIVKRIVTLDAYRRIR